MPDPNPGGICEIILDHSPDVAFSQLDGVIQWVSERIRDLLGWEPRDLIGRTMEHLWHPDDHGEALRLRRAVRRGEWVDGCVRVLHRDGRFVRVDLRAGPMHEGTPESVVGTLRKHDGATPAAQQLANSERAYKIIADNAQDVVATVDRSGVILTVTPSVEDWLGWRPEDLLGTFMPSLVHPDDRGRLAAYRHDVQDGIAAGRLEMRVQARGGAWKWISGSGAMAPGANGEDIIAVGWRDIDDLMRARTAAEIESARLRATLDASLDPRVMLTAVRSDDGEIVDFRIDDANPRACGTIGLTRDRLIGMRLLDVLPVVRDNGLLEAYSDAVESGEPCELDDVTIADPVAGSSRRYDIRAQAVGDSLMYTWRDVTARGRAFDDSTQAAIHFGTIARHAGDVVVHVVDGVIAWCSGSGHPLLQCRVGERLEDALTRLLGADDGRRMAEVRATLAEDARYVGVWHAHDGAGRAYDLLVRAEGRGVNSEHPAEIVIAVTDVTDVESDGEHDHEFEDTLTPNGDS